MQKGNNLAVAICMVLLSGLAHADNNYFSVDITGPEGRGGASRAAPPPARRAAGTAQSGAARVIPPPAPLPPGVTTQGTYQIRGNDTLWTIANAYLPPERGYNEYQIIASLYRFNPHAFINGDINRLIAGATLNVPSPAIIALEQTQSGVNVLQNGLRTLPAIDLPQAGAANTASNAPLSDDELDRVIATINPTAPSAAAAPSTAAGPAAQTAAGAQAAPFVPPAYAPAQAAPAAAPATTQPAPAAPAPAQVAPAPAPVPAAAAAPAAAPVTALPASPPMAAAAPPSATTAPLPDLASLAATGPSDAKLEAEQPASHAESDIGEQIDILAIKNIIDTFDKKIERKTDRFEKDMANNMKRAEKIAQSAAENTAQTKVDDLMVKYESMITDLQTTNAELRGTISKLNDQITKVRKTALDTQDQMAMMDARLDSSPSAHSFSVQGPLMWIVLGLGTLSLIMAATLMALKKKRTTMHHDYHRDDDIGDLDDDMGELLTSGISINPNDPDNASFPDDRPPDGGGPGSGAPAPARQGEFTDDAIQVPDDLMKQAAQSTSTSAPAATSAQTSAAMAHSAPAGAAAAAAAARTYAQTARDTAEAAAPAAPAVNKQPAQAPAEIMSAAELEARRAWEAAAAEAPSSSVADAIAASAAKAAQAVNTEHEQRSASKASGGATAELDAMADWGEALAAQASAGTDAPQAAVRKAQQVQKASASPAAQPARAAAAKSKPKAAAKVQESAAHSQKPHNIPGADVASAAASKAAVAPKAAAKVAAAKQQSAAQAAAPAAKTAQHNNIAPPVAQPIAPPASAKLTSADKPHLAAAAAPEALAEAAEAELSAGAAPQAAQAVSDLGEAVSDLAAAAAAAPEALAEAADIAPMFDLPGSEEAPSELAVEEFAGSSQSSAQPEKNAASAPDELSADINMSLMTDHLSGIHAPVHELTDADNVAQSTVSGAEIADMDLAGMHVDEALSETDAAARLQGQVPVYVEPVEEQVSEAVNLENTLKAARAAAQPPYAEGPLDAQHLQESLQERSAAPDNEEMSLAEQQMRESMFSIPEDAANEPELAVNELAGMNVADALAELDASQHAVSQGSGSIEQNLAGMNVEEALAELDASQPAPPSAAQMPQLHAGAGTPPQAIDPAFPEGSASDQSADIMNMLSGNAPGEEITLNADKLDMSAEDITNMITRSPADELSAAAEEQVLNADITLDGPAEEALQPQPSLYAAEDQARSGGFVEDVRSNAQNDMFGQQPASQQQMTLDTMEYRRFTDELNLAHLYFETGDTDEAMNIVNEVIEKGNDELIQKARNLASQYAS